MKKHLMAKEQIVCYAMLLFEAVAVASCYAIKINFWIHKAYIDASSAIIFCGIVLLVLLLASLLISLYFKQLAIEKKILIMLGSIAISLGVLGFADLVLENQLKYLDTIYKSLQLFVGEFEYVALYRRPVPPMINAARFLALFVTFGTIFTIILKQRIYGLNIKLFYRDVLIISNDPEGYVNDLANKLVNENRKVIIAYTKDTDDADQIASGKIPVVSIDIAKNIENDLKICNVKHARDIYLLCDCTLDNIKLVKSIYPMLKTKKKGEEGNVSSSVYSPKRSNSI